MSRSLTTPRVTLFCCNVWYSAPGRGTAHVQTHEDTHCRVIVAPRRRRFRPRFRSAPGPAVSAAITGIVGSGQSQAIRYPTHSTPAIADRRGVHRRSAAGSSKSLHPVTSGHRAADTPEITLIGTQSFGRGGERNRLRTARAFPPVQPHCSPLERAASPQSIGGASFRGSTRATVLPAGSSALLAATRAATSPAASDHS